jgi:hypothetical protein
MLYAHGSHFILQNNYWVYRSQYLNRCPSPCLKNTNRLADAFLQSTCHEFEDLIWIELPVMDLELEWRGSNLANANSRPLSAQPRLRRFYGLTDHRTGETVWLKRQRIEDIYEIHIRRRRQGRGWFPRTCCRLRHESDSDRHGKAVSRSLRCFELSRGIGANWET